MSQLEAVGLLGFSSVARSRGAINANGRRRITRPQKHAGAVSVMERHRVTLVGMGDDDRGVLERRGMDTT